MKTWEKKVAEGVKYDEEKVGEGQSVGDSITMTRYHYVFVCVLVPQTSVTRGCHLQRLLQVSKELLRIDHQPINRTFRHISIVHRCKSLRTPANTLIVNLAVSDGLMTLKAPIFIFNCVKRGPALGDKACRVYGFLGGLTGTLSIITLSVISFDRYFVIRYPLKRNFSDIRIKICLVIAWLYGTLFAIIPTLDIGFGKYTYEGYLTSCSFDYLSDDPRIKKFIFTFFVAAWVIPFSLISFSYFNIMKVVTGRTITNKRGRDSFRHVKEEGNKKQEIKLAFVVLCTIMMWFLSWTPYAVVALLGIFDQKHLITPIASMIPALFCKTASCLNSYVYALSHPKFKKELKNMCCTRLRKKREKKHKVWHTDFPQNQMEVEHEDSEEEIIEVNVGNLARSTGITQFHEKSQRIVPPKRTLRREETVIELLCLRPSFRNRPSSFRRIARRWSSKERQTDKNDENESNLHTDS
ncbi:hypothetical protein JTB14_017633 [Gonioctena quinquepunctata]|nr:hypothetical protein JTB14_017633 [Gonioctena quinquepunctata]